MFLLPEFQRLGTVNKAVTIEGNAACGSELNGLLAREEQLAPPACRIHPRHDIKSGNGRDFAVRAEKRATTKEAWRTEVAICEASQRCVCCGSQMTPKITLGYSKRASGGSQKRDEGQA